MNSPVMPPPLERDIQKAIVDFIGYACPHLYCFAVPNSAVRGKGKRAGNAVAGLRAGVADLVILARPGRVFMMEVKRPGRYGKVSDDQAKHAREMELRRIDYVIVTSLEEAIKALQQWGLIQRSNVNLWEPKDD
jgi:hypothetical protein